MPSWASSGSLSTTPRATTSRPRTSPSVCQPALGLGGTGSAGRRGSSGTSQGKRLLGGRRAGWSPRLWASSQARPAPLGAPGVEQGWAAGEGPSAPHREPPELPALCRGWALGSWLSTGQSGGQRLGPGAAEPRSWAPKQTVTGRQLCPWAREAPPAPCLFFPLLPRRYGRLQLGGHPQRLHHRPLRLRPHGPHLRQAESHQEAAAQPADLQPPVSRRGGRAAPRRFTEGRSGWPRASPTAGRTACWPAGSMREPCAYVTVLASPSLSFLVCRVGITTAPASDGCREI